MKLRVALKLTGSSTAAGEIPSKVTVDRPLLANFVFHNSCSIIRHVDLCVTVRHFTLQVFDIVFLVHYHYPRPLVDRPNNDVVVVE
ncbi:hypothetical protein DPMN_178924 [Dreissena polymorpha]|uniref:Uncharacterized protein n=1 Tax=Dreissena polymorpha TaxID=45954 RepID=A0A9D4EBU7_DREPO|nr:hypothetical protein DPMN_178924 [Dreissena polymorpha]